MTPGGGVGRMSKSVTGGLQGGQSSIIGGSGDVPQSSMIEREKRALEKIKARQRKDIEQMMEYEIQMERIRLVNEEKMKKAREKEERRR